MSLESPTSKCKACSGCVGYCRFNRGDGFGGLIGVMDMVLTYFLLVDDFQSSLLV